MKYTGCYCEMEVIMKKHVQYVIGRLVEATLLVTFLFTLVGLVVGFMWLLLFGIPMLPTIYMWIVYGIIFLIILFGLGILMHDPNNELIKWKE